MKETNLQTPVSKEEEEVFPGARAEIPLEHTVLKTKLRQAVHLQSIEVYGGVDIHVQTMEDPCWSRWICLSLCGKSMQEQSVPQGLHLMEGTFEPPMGRTHVGETCGGLSPVEGIPPAGTGGRRDRDKV